MCSWNNILSLFTSGTEIYVCFSDVLEMTNVGKGQREKLFLEGRQKLMLDTTSISFILEGESFEFSSLWDNLHARMRVWYYIFRIKNFPSLLAGTFVYVRFTCDQYLVDALKMTSLNKWPKKNCKSWKEGKK